MSDDSHIFTAADYWRGNKVLHDMDEHPEGVDDHVVTIDTVTCPTSPLQPNGEPHTIIGCGSTNVVLDDDGMYDCLDCGICFYAEVQS